jgi:hypothetical protein
MPTFAYLGVVARNSCLYLPTGGVVGELPNPRTFDYARVRSKRIEIA